MLRNWLHIILSLWLINTVTYFQSGNPADSFSQVCTIPQGEDCVKVNSWTDCILQSITNDDDSPVEKAHKIKFQRRYVRNRSVNDRVFIPASGFSVYFEAVKLPLLHTVNKFFIGIAKLPAYYNFLFRFSPF